MPSDTNSKDTDKAIYEKVQRSATATFSPSSGKIQGSVEHSFKKYDKSIEQNSRPRSQSPLPSAGQDETIHHRTNSGFLPRISALQPEDGMTRNPEVQPEASSVSFTQPRTKSHFVPDMSLGSFPTLGYLNANYAFPKQHVVHAAADDGPIDILSLRDVRLPKQGFSRHTTPSSQTTDADLQSEEAAKHEIIPGRLVTEAQTSAGKFAHVVADPQPGQVTAYDSDINVSLPPIEAKEDDNIYRPGKFTKREPRPVMPPSDTARRAQKDEKSTQKLKPPVPNSPPDYEVQLAIRDVRNAFDSAIHRIRDEVDTAMESLYIGFNTKLTEIEEDARQRKKEVWNSGLRAQERKVEGLEKQIEQLKVELKDTRDKLPVRTDADETLKSMYKKYGWKDGSG